MAAVRPLSAPPPMMFELTVVDLDPLHSTLSALGELDLCARRALTDRLQEQQDAGRRFVSLDLSGVTFMDCSCLGVVDAFHHSFLELRGLLVLTGITLRTARLLALTGLRDSLFVAPDGRDLPASTSLRKEQVRRA